MSPKWVHLRAKQVCLSLLKRAIVSCGRVGSTRTSWFERKFLKPMREILVKHYPPSTVSRSSLHQLEIRVVRIRNMFQSGCHFNGCNLLLKQVSRSLICWQPRPVIKSAVYAQAGQKKKKNTVQAISVNSF